MVKRNKSIKMKGDTSEQVTTQQHKIYSKKKRQKGQLNHIMMYEGDTSTFCTAIAKTKDNV